MAVGEGRVLSSLIYLKLVLLIAFAILRICSWKNGGKEISMKIEWKRLTWPFLGCAWIAVVVSLLLWAMFLLKKRLAGSGLDPKLVAQVLIIPMAIFAISYLLRSISRGWRKKEFGKRIWVVPCVLYALYLFTYCISYEMTESFKHLTRSVSAVSGIVSPYEVNLLLGIPLFVIVVLILCSSFEGFYSKLGYFASFIGGALAVSAVLLPGFLNSLTLLEIECDSSVASNSYLQCQQEIPIFHFALAGLGSLIMLFLVVSFLSTVESMLQIWLKRQIASPDASAS